MSKIIELSDQNYSIMAAAAAQRGEPVDVMMTRWLRDLASGSVNPNGAESEIPAITPVSITTAPTTGSGWQRARGPLAVALVVLTCFAFVGSVLSVWVHQSLLDTNNFVSTVDPLLKNPGVIDSVSAYTANQIVEVLNVQERAQNALPDRASFLAAPLTNTVQNFAQTRIAQLMKTDKFQAAWDKTLRFVHAKVVGILRGDSRYLTIQGNALTLDLTLVITDALRYLQAQLPDLVQSKLPIPDLSSVIDPAKARQRLSDALGRTLPDDFGQVTIMQADQLVTAQRSVQLLDALTIILPLLTLVLLIAAVWVSLNRRLTLLQLGIGLAFAMLVVLLLIKFIENRVVSAVTTQPGSGIVSPTLDALLGGLTQWLIILLVVGVVVAIIAFFANKGHWFAAAYRWLRDTFANLRERFSGSPAPSANS
jgi:hypothetical protein